MKTWEEIKADIRRDTWKDNTGTNNYTEFADTLVHYFKIGLAQVNAKYIKHRANKYSIGILIEYKSKLYIVKVSNYRLSFYVGLCQSEREFDIQPSSSGGKSVYESYATLSPEDLFKNVKFPNHAKFNEGELVYIWNRSYNHYNNGELARITSVDYNSNSIEYRVELFNKSPVENNHNNRVYYYAESNLKKCRGGL